MIVAAMMAVFAAIQLNDPDPLAWVIAYGVTGIYSAVAAFRRLPIGLIVAWGCIIALGAASTLWTWDGSSQPMGAAWQGIFAEEVVRELGGLSIAFAWTVVLGIVSLRPTPERQNSERGPGGSTDRP